MTSRVYNTIDTFLHGGRKHIYTRDVLPYASLTCSIEHCAASPSPSLQPWQLSSWTMSSRLLKATARQLYVFSWDEGTQGWWNVLTPHNNGLIRNGAKRHELIWVLSTQTTTVFTLGCLMAFKGHRSRIPLPLLYIMPRQRQLLSMQRQHHRGKK